MRKILLVLILLTVSFYLSCSSGCDDKKEQRKTSQRTSTLPWVKDITIPPLRTVSVTDVTTLKAAITAAVAGDWIELAGGTYATGQLVLTKSGTAANPIVIKPKKDAHAIVHGNFKMTGAHTYVRDLEITNGAMGFIGVEVQCNNCGVINNVIHHNNGQVGLFAYNLGANQIIYGNIFYDQKANSNNPHNFYGANDYNTYGMKYVVGNVFLDSVSADLDPSSPTPPTFNVHVYTEGGLISGFHLENNVASNGRFLMGGLNKPHHHWVVLRNHFHNAGVQLGYNKPVQSRFEDNVLWKSVADFKFQVGEGETDPSTTDPNTFIRNTLINPPSGRLINYMTAATGQVNGGPKIRSKDIWNDNTYISPIFGASLGANGIFTASLSSFNEWKLWASQRGGVNWDTNSTYSNTAIPTNKQFFIPNDYDQTRGHFVVYNFEGKTTAKLDRAGQFSVYNIKNTFGSPVVSGTDSVNVPLTKEFEVFLVKGGTTPVPEPEPEPCPECPACPDCPPPTVCPECPPPPVCPDPQPCPEPPVCPTCDNTAALQCQTELYQILMDPASNHQQKVRRARVKSLECYEKTEAIGSN